MNSPWQRITEVFQRALDADPVDRERVIAEAEIDDPAVAAEVRALLRAHDRSDRFLEEPAWAAAPDLLLESPDPGFLSGQRIGPYQVGEEIGRGGMGVVYAAHDARLGRTVALKMLPPAFSRDGQARERLAREARAAAALSHPSIATVYALEDIDGDLFIASELVRGSTLRKTLEGGRLSPSAVLDILGQIAGALEAAHREGIVHRDLKPENVLVAADGRIKVVDFGIARMLAPIDGHLATLTRTGAHLGTPGYMAPEQLRGRDVDARADVFAFGIIAYELATGVHPFGGSDPASLLERLVSDGSPLSHVIEPAGLDALVRRALKGDPAARYSSGGEIAAALRTLAEPPAAATPLPAAAAERTTLLETAWWWQFHQVAVAVITIAAVIHIGVNRDWIGRYGSLVFIGMLVLATISTTLRLHLWFVSLVHPATLRALRARVLTWIIACEGLYAASLLAIGVHLAGPHDGIAAHLVVTGMLMVLSLIVIEPATTKAGIGS
jgi:hypothetical protein